jgi:hypothetical protein
VGLALSGLICCALAAAPLAASATPLLFTVGADGYAFGVSEADAQDAQENSGLTIISSPVEVQGENLSITAETVPGSAFVGPDAGGATQNFTVTNDSGPHPTNSEDQLLLVFKSFDTAVAGISSHDYLGSYSEREEGPDPGTLTTVGFDVSPDWFLVSFYDDVLDQTVYFPAVALGALAQGDSTTVPISSWLTEPRTTLSEDLSTQLLMLPTLLYDAAFIPIPEPATGLLLGLGLVGLTWCGSKRSCSRA